VVSKPSLRLGSASEGHLEEFNTNIASDTTSPSKAAATAKASSAASKTAGPASKTAKASGTAAATTGAAASASGTQKGGAKTSGGAAVTSINPVLPAGGVNMLQPSALAQTTYYKIADYVSFAWNYTSLSITPSKIDVLVSCAANSATYTLANNASFKPTDTVVWDTAPDVTGTAPLLTETYTLIIYDAAQAITAVAGAGRLGISDDLRFGMYIKQSYTPRAGEPRRPDYNKAQRRVLTSIS